MAIVTNSHRGPLWGVLFIIIIITLFPIRSSHTAKICAKGNSDSTASTSSCLSHDLNNGQSSLQEYKYLSCLHLFIYVQKIGAPPPRPPLSPAFPRSNTKRIHSRGHHNILATDGRGRDSHEYPT